MRRKSTGITCSGRLRSAGCDERVVQFGKPRFVMRAQLRDPHGYAAERRPCDGSTSVSRRSDSNARQRIEESPERDRHRARRATRLTLVLILGSSMSPAINTRLALVASDACSGEWP